MERGLLVMASAFPGVCSERLILDAGLRLGCRRVSGYGGMWVEEG
jgi:hypothetical protein